MSETKAASFRKKLRLRVLLLWFGAIVSAFTIIVIPIVLGTAYIWRNQADETRYESHFEKIISTLWFGFFLFSTAAALFPFYPVATVGCAFFAASQLLVIGIRGLMTTRKSLPYRRLRLFV